MQMTNKMFHIHITGDSLIFPTFLKAFIKLFFVNVQNSKQEEKKIPAYLRLILCKLMDIKDLNIN